jgi:putative aldouronate transport system substrate-binding protein
MAMTTQGEASHNVSRRGFLAGALATAVGVPLLNACAPAATPAAPAGGGQPAAGAAGAASAAKSLFPTYIPPANGPKPDYHDANPLYSDAFDTYPANPVKANGSEAPGAGSTVNILVTAYFPVPTIKEQNPTWQAIDKALNVTTNMTIIPGGDYRTRFATTMASNDLPDIMHIFFGYSVAPNLPGFFKSKCADLTPYLSGDAAKDYPNLAAIPTPAWKNSISAVDGALYLIPIHRQMTSIPPRGGNFFKNVDMWDTELGQDFVPKNADDFKKALTQLNRPQENRWAMGAFGTNDTLFGIGNFAQVFNAPNNWKLDSAGKLIKDRETAEYKATVGFMRDLFTSGLVWPDSIQATNNVRADFVGKKFAMSPDGQGNSWVDFWQRGLTQANPPTHFGMIKPFAAQDGQKPISYLGTGFVSMNVLKKASPDRIKELLRVLNWLAAPFGSQEDLMLTYGLKDQDYSLDAKGNPRPTPDGTGRAGYVPWRYLAQHPWVYYQADIDGFAKASHEAEMATIPLGVDDPTNGFLAPTLYGKGANADMVFWDGVRDVVLSRRPMSDYDQLVSDWKTTAGDQIRKEYTDAMAAK